ncbi:uncharacterized protein LOC112569635 [Pomacea canaliculata]|uniref:uncharacterized protein LOC112569635 n=1 Tax=Pomacea canaliculata TaxID=400727 RepID=UPI000D72C3B4|nr:uncharacterized protein LOC112569635 [Pomacea canaliculata]
MNYRFKCVDIQPNNHVSWLITKVDPTSSNQNQMTNVEVCYFNENVCQSFNEFTSAVKSNGDSILTYNPSQLDDTVSVTCRVFDNMLTRATSYMNDYTCNITLIRTAWCTVGNILDPTKNYECKFTEELENGSPGRMFGTQDGTHSFVMKAGNTAAECFFTYNYTLGINAFEVNLLPDNVRGRAIFHP